MCSGCGAVKTKLHLGERVYHCQHCGLEIDRDRNAAINVARHALRATEPSTGGVTGGARPSLRARLVAVKPAPFHNGGPARNDRLPEMPVIQTLAFQVTVLACCALSAFWIEVRRQGPHGNLGVSGQGTQVGLGCAACGQESDEPRQVGDALEIGDVQCIAFDVRST